MLGQFLINFDAPIDNDYFENIKEHIVLYGYNWKVNDDEILKYVANYEIEHLKNLINADTIPVGLQQYLHNKIVSVFYSQKSIFGQLDDFDFNSAVKQISLGDTSYTFAGSDLSDEEKFFNYLKGLSGDRDWLAYRKVKW